MELQITGKDINISPAIRGHIERKLGRLDRHLPNITGAKAEVSTEKTKSPQQHFVVQITIDSSGTLLRGEERGEDLFTAIDKVAQTMDRQIEHYKGKLYSKGRGSSFARNSTSTEAEAALALPRVVKVKRFGVKPMSIAEAIDQMELLGHDFFLFYNAESEVVNVLYQRKDGNYGLIEPDMG